MKSIRSITPCLWFENQAEEAANYYVGIFPNSKISRVARYGEAGYEIHRMPAGSVLTVDFELDGHPLTALNGGPAFRFSEAVSFQVICESQEQVDYYWEKLTHGGDEKAQQCGWLKDKFGLSWQVIPEEMIKMFGDGESGRSERAMTAMLQMKKLDLEAMRRAYQG